MKQIFLILILISNNCFSEDKKNRLTTNLNKIGEHLSINYILYSRLKIEQNVKDQTINKVDGNGIGSLPMQLKRDSFIEELSNQSF